MSKSAVQTSNCIKICFWCLTEYFLETVAVFLIQRTVQVVPREEKKMEQVVFFFSERQSRQYVGAMALFKGKVIYNTRRLPCLLKQRFNYSWQVGNHMNKDD